jgi:hypothetical protein
LKLLNGFGKKYFTLCSIQAYAVAPKLHSVITSYKNHINTKLTSSENEKDEEESPPNLEEILLSSFLQNSKPCHCDCFFKRKTALAVNLFKFIPRCQYYCKFFAFRRTGTHPPTLTY